MPEWSSAPRLCGGRELVCEAVSLRAAVSRRGPSPSICRPGSARCLLEPALAVPAPCHLRPFLSPGLRGSDRALRIIRPAPALGGGRVYGEWAQRVHPRVALCGALLPRASRESGLQSGGGVVNGTDAACCCSCAVFPRLGRGGGDAGGLCGFRDLACSGLVARRMHTCAESCVWCWEAGVCVSRGHRSVPVCVYACV